MSGAHYDKMIGGKGGKEKGQMIEIYLLRHGESEANESNMTQGSEYDTGLTKLGAEQATKTGEYFLKYRNVERNFDAIYSSPLKRARETAEIIKKETGFDRDIIFDHRLVERSKGKIAGLDRDSQIVQNVINEFKSLEPADPVAYYDINERHKIYMAVHSKYGIGKDSDLNLDKKAGKILKDLVKSGHSKILIVSHGSFLAAVIRAMVNIAWVPFVSNKNCWIAYVTYGPKDKVSGSRFRLESPPNVGHLEM